MRGWNPLVPLVLISVVAVAACEKPPTEPTGQTDTFLAKPSCPGHPSCKPDDPPGDPGAAPDPVIAFTIDGGLWVMNADGSNQVRIPTGNADRAWHPSWAPSGDGTEANMYRIVFESDHTLYTVGVWIDGTSIRSTPPQLVSSVSPSAGEPDWGPSGEIVYWTTVLAVDGLEHDAIYVIADTDLPDPTPIEVYVATDGWTEENDHGLYGPAWSPGGDAIMFVEEDEAIPYRYDKTLRIIDRATGDQTTVLEYGEFHGSGWGMDWSGTDPSYLAFVEERPKKKHGFTPELYKLPLTDGAGDYLVGSQPVLVTTGFVFPTWSADDTRFVAYDFHAMRTIDASTGTVLATLSRNNARSSDWRR